MTLTLIHAPYSRSGRIVWLLEELGAPYDMQIVEIDRGVRGGKADPANPHPYKRVPALVADGETVFETVAIILYLTDAYPAAKLAPRVGEPQRGQYASWLAFYAGGLEPAFMTGQFDMPKGSTGWPKRDEAMAVLETQLKDRPYLLGDSFTAVDLLYASTFNFFATVGMFQPPEWLAAYVKRCIDRPAFARAQAKDNG